MSAETAHTHFKGLIRLWGLSKFLQETSVGVSHVCDGDHTNNTVRQVDSKLIVFDFFDSTKQNSPLVNFLQPHHVISCTKQFKSIVMQWGTVKCLWDRPLLSASLELDHHLRPAHPGLYPSPSFLFWLLRVSWLDVQTAEADQIKMSDGCKLTSDIEEEIYGDRGR